MIWLDTQPPHWRDSWRANFRVAWTPQPLIVNALLVRGSPGHTGESAADVFDVCRDARAIGLATLPGIGHVLGSGYESWFALDTWRRVIDFALACAGATDLMSPRRAFVLDLEPDWTGERKYVAWADWPRFLAAVAPLYELLRYLRMGVWLMPAESGAAYVHETFWHQPYTSLDESTYADPAKAAVHREQCTIRGLAYLPGYNGATVKAGLVPCDEDSFLYVRDQPDWRDFARTWGFAPVPTEVH